MSQTDPARASRNARIDDSQSLREAKNKSICAIYAVAVRIETRRSLQTTAAIEMFCSHFEARWIPNPRNSLSSEDGLLSLAVWAAVYSWMSLGNSHESLSTSLGPAFSAVIARACLHRLVTATPGITRLVTVLWKNEDVGLGPPIPYPVFPVAFYRVVHGATEAVLQEVVVSGGGHARDIVRLAISHLQSTISDTTTPASASTFCIRVRIVDALSRSASHPLRREPLGEGSLAVVMLAFIRASFQVASRVHDSDEVEACVQYISGVVEAGSGPYYVREVMQAGVLLAIVNTLPSFQQLDSATQECILSLVGDVIPRYIVYRSVVVAVGSAVKRLDMPGNRAKITESPVRDAWDAMERLASKRSLIKSLSPLLQSLSQKCSQTMLEMPDHLLLQKLSSRCLEDSAQEPVCGSTERLYQAARNDASVTRDAWRNRLRLRDMAARLSPAALLSELGVVIDFPRVPPAVDVFILKDREFFRDAGSAVPQMQIARSESMVKKACLSEGCNTLIESTVRAGKRIVHFLALTSSSFWAEEVDALVLKDEELGSNINEIDLMMAGATIEDEEEGDFGPVHFFGTS
ncbi:hypothetical protein BV25DRAFT_1836637 [Artomyces pyxidatus]|uniref:Uncharacterized protein n=1 Tax=Artomyces pyxidatus TaxID=48021 RepID=A0ACB8T7M0_9AGAM|nr:hypothetical protein BV25DRAFT_1836637 [Artomyces pyxidatus]